MSILITGASGGLGPAVVNAFLASGGAVFGVARSWSQSTRPSAPKLHLIEADVSTDEGCDTAVESAKPVDALVHLVGGYAGGTNVAETSDAVFDQMLNVNLRSAFRMIRAVLPDMRERGRGRILVIGSRAADAPAPGSAAYNASKAGLAALIRTLALEVKDCGVTANLVAPTIIDTPANRAAMPTADHTRWVKPDSIARLLVWLASQEADDVNGAVIPIAGRA